MRNAALPSIIVELDRLCGGQFEFVTPQKGGGNDSGAFSQ